MSKLLKPYKGFSVFNITQGFNPTHHAIDSAPVRKGLSPYGTPLVAPEKVTIGKVYGNEFDHSDPHSDAPIKNGYGMWMTGESGLQILYWHTQPIFPVKTGDVVERGTIIAYCGNSGNVTVSGVYVPIEDRDNAPFLGTHLHEQIVKDTVLVNPLDYIDMETEPTYTILDELKAMGITLAKIAHLL